MVILLVAVIIKGGMISFLAHSRVSIFLDALSLHGVKPQRSSFIRYRKTKGEMNLQLAMSWERPVPVSKQTEVLV